MMDKINTQYNKAVKLIKSAILQNQLEAAKAVNRQILAYSHYTMVWASMSLTIHAKEFGALEPLKLLVNSLGENCQDCEDLACLTLKTCDNFMNHGTSL